MTETIRVESIQTVSGPRGKVVVDRAPGGWALYDYNTGARLDNRVHPRHIDALRAAKRKVGAVKGEGIGNVT